MAVVASKMDGIDRGISVTMQLFNFQPAWWRNLFQSLNGAFRRIL